MFIVLVIKSSHTDTCRYTETEAWERTKISLIRSASNAKEIWVNYLNEVHDLSIQVCVIAHDSMFVNSFLPDSLPNASVS